MRGEVQLYVFTRNSYFMLNSLVGAFILKLYKRRTSMRHLKYRNTFKVTPLIVSAVEIQIPYGKISKGIAQLMAPLIMGMIINQFQRKKSEQGWSSMLWFENAIFL